MNHAHMQKRCPDAVFLAPALLRNWRLDFLYRSTSFPGGGAADIVRDEGSVLWGVVWRVSPSDLIELDRYEDVALGGYEREKIWIELPDSRQMAITYQVRNKLEETLPPREDYLQIMLRGARESGLPAEYINSLGEL